MLYGVISMFTSQLKEKEKKREGLFSSFEKLRFSFNEPDMQALLNMPDMLDILKSAPQSEEAKFLQACQEIPTILDEMLQAKKARKIKVAVDKLDKLTSKVKEVRAFGEKIRAILPSEATQKQKDLMVIQDKVLDRIENNLASKTNDIKQKQQQNASKISTAAYMAGIKNLEAIFQCFYDIFDPQKIAEERNKTRAWIDAATKRNSQNFQRSHAPSSLVVSNEPKRETLTGLNERQLELAVIEDKEKHMEQLIMTHQHQEVLLEEELNQNTQQLKQLQEQATTLNERASILTSNSDNSEQQELYAQEFVLETKIEEIKKKLEREENLISRFEITVQDCEEEKKEIFDEKELEQRCDDEQSEIESTTTMEEIDIDEDDWSEELFDRRALNSRDDLEEVLDNIFGENTSNDEDFSHKRQAFSGDTESNATQKASSTSLWDRIKELGGFSMEQQRKKNQARLIKMQAELENKYKKNEQETAPTLSKTSPSQDALGRVIYGMPTK